MERTNHNLDGQGGFAFLKHTVLQAACLLVLLLVCRTAAGQTSTGFRTKTPDIRKNAFLMPYAHPNQSNLSVWAGVGFGGYSGDICRLIDRKLQGNHLNPGITAGLSYRLTNYASLRWANSFQSLGAKARPGTWGGWAFRSRIGESAVVGQVSLFSKTNIEAAHEGWEAYALVGGGVLICQIKTSVDAVAYGRFGYLLVPPTRKISAVFPVGGGVAWHWNGQWSLGAEALCHFTTTDLLDGVSLSADPRPRKDNFLTLQVQVAHQLSRFFRYKAYLKRK